MPTQEELAQWEAAASAIVDAQIADERKRRAAEKQSDEQIATAAADAEAQRIAAEKANELTRLRAAEIAERMARGMSTEDALDFSIPTSPPAAVAPPPLPSGAYPDVSNSALTTAASIVEKVNSLQSYLDGNQARIDAKVKQRTAELMVEYRPWYSDTDENGRTISNSQGKALAAKKASQVADGLRREEAKIAEKQTEQQFAAIFALGQQLATIENLFKSPIDMLSRVGLGSSARLTVAQQIQNAGEAECKSLAAYAIATNNKILGAAVLAQMQGITIKAEGNTDKAIRDAGQKRKALSDGKSNLAASLCGADYAKVKNAIAMAKARIQDAKDSKIRFVRASSNLIKIKSGLREADID